MQKWLAKDNTMSDAEHEAFTRAIEHFEVALGHQMLRLEPQFARKILDNLRKQELVLMPTLEAKRELERDGVYRFRPEDLDDALEGLLHLCNDCQGMKSCDVRSFFLLANVPEYDPLHTLCPFCHK